MEGRGAGAGVRSEAAERKTAAAELASSAETHYKPAVLYLLLASRAVGPAAGKHTDIPAVARQAGRQASRQTRRWAAKQVMRGGGNGWIEQGGIDTNWLDTGRSVAGGGGKEMRKGNWKMEWHRSGH
jgi:hypothetical protein